MSTCYISTGFYIRSFFPREHIVGMGQQQQQILRNQVKNFSVRFSSILGEETKMKTHCSFKGKK
jgi:hypothetical protein